MFRIYGQTASPAATENLNFICQLILSGEQDSASFRLNKLEENTQVKSLKNIVAGKAAYADFGFFISKSNVTNKQQAIKLSEFIHARLTEPEDSLRVNLDFVKVKWMLIVQLANVEMLNNSAEETEELKTYISRFPPSDDVKRAAVLAMTNDILMGVIRKDTAMLKRVCLENIKTASALKDSFLIVVSRYYYSEYLILNKDLDGYIDNCLQALALEKNNKVKSYFYLPTIEHLLDALIYQGVFDELYIEELLHTVYSESETKYDSYSLYAQYMGASFNNPAAQQRIFRKFGVTDIVSFCDTLSAQAETAINSNELFHLYRECASTLFTYRVYDRAFEYKDKCVRLNKKIYTQELSQAIADNEIREVERVKQLENAELRKKNSEKELILQRQKIVLWVTFAAIFIFIVLLWFLFRAIRQRNKVNRELEVQKIEIEAANKDLKRLNILNQKIFSVISHDFKAPVLTLGMLLNSMKRKNLEPSLAEHVDEVASQFANANTVLDNLISWAKSEMDFQIEDNPRSDLKEIAAEILFQLKSTAENKQVSFAYDLAGDIVVPVPADVLRIVFRNLISNAIKYSYENAVVRIDFDRSQMQLRVTDTGMGMTEEKIRTLFQKDVVSSLGTKKEPGFGMGLYILTELLRKYQSTLAVKSELGKGSVFTVSFPTVR